MGAEELVERVGQQLGVQHEMAIFTAFGRRVQRPAKLFPPYRVVLIFIEGGVWHWPPIQQGYLRPLRLSGEGGRQMMLRTVSLQPRVFEVSHLLTVADFEHIRGKAEAHMAPSQDVLSAVGEDGARSSENYFLPSGKDPLLLDLDQRLQNLTRIPIINAEDAQVLRYDRGGRYGGHHDAFSAEFSARNEHTAEVTQGGSRNRALTVFMYLSDDVKGGETAFLRAGGLATPTDTGKCTSGLSVRPQRGKVLLFYNLHPNGVFDQMSMHAGCPVQEGTKWAANFWLWNYPQNSKRGARHKKMLANLLASGVMDQVEEETLGSLAEGGLVHRSGIAETDIGFPGKAEEL